MTPRVLGAFVAATALVVLYGWAADVEALKSPLGRVTMKTSTASALLFAGVLLAALPCVDGSRSLGDRAGSTVVSCCAWSVAVLMLGTLAEYLAKTNLGFSSFFVAEPDGARLSVAPGVPSVGTVVGLMASALLGFGVIVGAPWRARAVRVLALTQIAVGGVALVGHALDVPPLYYYGGGVSTAMAVHTAACVALLGVGALRLGEPGERGR